VNSVSGFVGTAKETVASAAAKGKSKVNELGTALKVATTALDRGNCMKTEFREIYDDNRRKYEEFMAGIRKQSNRVTTAISYSRTEAWTGWALIGFSLYMLSYLRNRGKDQRIDDRLAAIEAERRGRGRGEDEQLAIGNVDEGNAAGVLALGNGQLAIGNGDEGNAAGVLALGNGDEGNALRAPARAQALAQGFRQIGNDNNSNSSSSSSSSASNSNSNPSGSGVQRRDDNTKYGDQKFGSLNYKPSSSMFNSSSATTSNASSDTTSNSNSAAAAPPRSTTPKKQLLARRKAEEKDQGNSGGRRTRRRSRQTKKQRMRVKRRQTRKLRRNTKRRRM
jgi:hypothetical protein